MPIVESKPLPRLSWRDPESFTRLVDAHKDRLVGYLTRLCGSRDRAEELAQETFLRFYQMRHRYREEGHITAFLFRIATNLLRSMERRQRRWQRLVPLFTAGRARRDPGHEDQLLADEAQAQVSRALASLDLTYRAPLVLREIEGLPYQEIARALELSEGTVKSRIHRGKQKLKEALAPFWNGVP